MPLPLLASRVGVGMGMIVRVLVGMVVVTFVAVMVVPVAHEDFGFCLRWVRCKKISPVFMRGTPLGVLVALNRV